MCRATRSTHPRISRRQQRCGDCSSESPHLSRDPFPQLNRRWSTACTRCRHRGLQIDSTVTARCADRTAIHRDSRRDDTAAPSCSLRIWPRELCMRRTRRHRLRQRRLFDCRARVKWRYQHAEWPLRRFVRAQLKNADHTAWAVQDALGVRRRHSSQRHRRAAVHDVHRRADGADDSSSA